VDNQTGQTTISAIFTDVIGCSIHYTLHLWCYGDAARVKLA